MSLLTIAQGVARPAPVLVPTAVFGSNDSNALLLRSCLSRAGKSLHRMHDWTVLVKEYTFTTTASTANYVLPTDFARFCGDTVWDRANYERMRGPLSAQEWQSYKSSILGTSISRFRRHRVRLNTLALGTEFYLDPTPTASAETLAFEYVSTFWCKTSADAGLADWAADTDVGVIDEHLIELAATWRFFDRLGMAYGEAKAECDEETDKAWARDSGMMALSLVPSAGIRFIGPENVPDTGMGS